MESVLVTQFTGEGARSSVHTERLRQRDILSVRANALSRTHPHAHPRTHVTSPHHEATTGRKRKKTTQLITPFQVFSAIGPKHRDGVCCHHAQTADFDTSESELVGTLERHHHHHSRAAAAAAAALTIAPPFSLTLLSHSRELAHSLTNDDSRTLTRRTNSSRGLTHSLAHGESGGSHTHSHALTRPSEKRRRGVAAHSQPVRLSCVCVCVCVCAVVVSQLAALQLLHPHSTILHSYEPVDRFYHAFNTSCAQETTQTGLKQPSHRAHTPGQHQLPHENSQ